MDTAFGIINSSGNRILVEGLQKHRPIGAFSFLGRYRTIDFPISNMSNSGIDRIQIYVRRQPTSLVEHLGTGRHYNINSKRGKLQILFSENRSENNIYNTDISAFAENIESIEAMPQPYVVIAPSHMIFRENFETLLQTHIDSEADITLLYHEVNNADESFMSCNILNLNRQNHLLSIEENKGNEKNRDIFMDTYVMKKELFIELIQRAKKLSSIYTLSQIVSIVCNEFDIRGVQHEGYFAAITDLKSYYDANLSLVDFDKAMELFHKNWPVYTRTHDSCPTQYEETADVKNSVISNSCVIEGTLDNSIVGRGCVVKKGAVVKNSILLPDSYIGENVHIENQVVDKHAKLIHVSEVIATPEHPGYINRGDTL